MDRRNLLSTGSAAAVAALAGCATGTPASSSGSRTVFSVAQPMLPIVGTSEMFPVRRIYCIGRNYAAHAREMGSDPNREPPFFFQKRATRSSSSPSAPPPTIRTRRLPRTTTTRSSSSRRSARAAATCPSKAHSRSSTATPSAST